MKREEEINKIIKDEKLDTNLISDGYHTFKDLYEHRMTLFVVLCNTLEILEVELGKGGGKCWKSKLHNDGTMFPGDWFIAGIGKEKKEQITYHLRTSIYWDKLIVPELSKAPEWDGHTPADVVKRFLEL